MATLKHSANLKYLSKCILNYCELRRFTKQNNKLLFADARRVISVRSVCRLLAYQVFCSFNKKQKKQK